MITIIGLGYVGLTAGLGFAKKGFKTFGIDVNAEYIESLKNYKVPFHEPYLEDVLHETLGHNFLVDISLEEAVRNSEIIFLCVGTPGNEDGSADLSHIYEAIDDIIAVDSDGFKVLVVKSTVPPSTLTERIKPHVLEKIKGTGKEFGLASNPEFLREGHGWEDFIEPDRIVIGVEDERSRELLDYIYKPFNAPHHFVSPNTSEFTKYLSNTMLSTLISFSNEMSIIADKIGDIDIPESFRIFHEDKRWYGYPAAMTSYVYPGCGYGGYCLPKDTEALNAVAESHGAHTNILSGNLYINEKIKDHLVSKLEREIPKNEPIGILGLSFKPGSGDVRITPAKRIIELMMENGFSNISAYDPVSNEAFKEEYPDLDITFYDELETMVEKNEHLVILTGWKEFKERKVLINKKNVFDFRYIY